MNMYEISSDEFKCENLTLKMNVGHFKYDGNSLFNILGNKIPKKELDNMKDLYIQAM